MSASTSPYNDPAFWERVWRSSGIQFVGLFIVASVIYGSQPQVGASADALVAFYNGDRTRILIGAFFSGLNLLNLLWFTAAPEPPWRMQGKTVGGRRRLRLARRSERCSFYRSRWEPLSPTRSPAPAITCSLPA